MRDGRGCSRRPRRCPAWTSGSSVRERLGGAHPARRGVEQLARASGVAEPPRMSQSASHGVQRRASAPRARRGAAGRPGPARRGWPGCRRPGARPPCGTSGVFGATLARHGTRREIASMSATPKSSSASRAAASRCSTVLVEPPIATSSATAFSNAARVAIARGSTESSSLVVVAPGQVDDEPAGRLEERLAGGVGGQRRAVAGQRQADRLGQAVHRVGGEHARAGAAGRAGGALDLAELLVGDRVVGGGDHRVDQVELGVHDALDGDRLAGLHRAAGDEDGRDVQPQRGQQHARA